MKLSSSVSTSSSTPTTQLNSRGFLYDPVRNTRNMCSSTMITIRCAPQRCMLRSSLPKGTSFSRYRMSRKATTFDGMVVEHQQRAGENQRDVDVERHAAHAPGVVVAHGVAIDLGGMQVQEDVGEHAQRAAARRFVVLVAEDRSVDLGLRSGSLSPSICSLALAGISVLRDCRSSLIPAVTFSSNPVCLPFLPFSSGMFSSDFSLPACHS